MKARQRYILFAIILVVGIALDQITKMLATEHLMGEGRIEVVGKLFSFVYALNEGAFLSMGASWSPMLRLIVLTIIPGLLLISFLIYMLRSDKHAKGMSVAFALVSAGGLGNIIDRVLAGQVVDFMHMDFGIFQTGVFNVADIYIMVGVGILIIQLWRDRKRQTKATEEAAEDTAELPEGE